MRLVNFRFNVDRTGKEASFLNKKELVSVLMDSPLYFSYSINERKELVENLGARIRQKRSMEQSIPRLAFTSVIQTENRYVIHIVSKYLFSFLVKIKQMGIKSL